MASGPERDGPPPYPTVLVGTDGSDTATEAVRRAARYADAFGVPLRVVTVYERTHPADLGPPSQRAQMPGEAWMSADYRAAQDVGRDAVSLAEKIAPGLDADSLTPEGNPADRLLDLADEHPGCLLVVGSQGMDRSARFLLGGVPHKVSHHAVGDVLVVRTGDGRPDRLPQRVLVGHDGSQRSGKVLGPATAIARATGARVTVLTVHDDEEAAQAALVPARERMAAAGADVETAWAGGDPADALLEAAGDVDLVVIGNRGMTGVERFMLGSVPNKVSHHIDRDLLIVKTNERRGGA